MNAATTLTPAATDPIAPFNSGAGEWSAGRVGASAWCGLALVLLAWVIAPAPARSQAPASPQSEAAPAWPADVELRRTIAPPGARSQPTPPNATVPLRPSAQGVAPGMAAPSAAPPEARRDPSKAAVTLSAFLTQDGEAVDQGVVWRVYTEPPTPAAGAQPTPPALIGTWREPNPVVSLAPGAYVVNVAYGRAHLTRKVSVASPAALDERFILNAGGLRVTCVMPGGEKTPDNSVTYDIYQGDADQLGGRTRLVAGLRPGLIVRLNAGLYHVISTLGDANAVVNADVTVEAGKLTDAVLTHHAARVTMKLVTRAGGEAQADTQWAVHTLQGDLVRETQGALPTHILAAGQYIASARHAGRLYQSQFTVSPGEPAQVEIVMQ